MPHIDPNNPDVILLREDPARDMWRNREIEFLEGYYRERTLDYPMALMEFRLDAEGTGRGITAPMVQMFYNPDTSPISVTDWDTRPVRLTNVRIAE